MARRSSVSQRIPINGHRYPPREASVERATKMIRAGVFAALCATALSACASNLPDEAAASAARGRAVARQVCAACHAVEPGDASPRPDTRPFWNRGLRHTALLEGRLQQLTSKGHYAMPRLALSPEDLRDVATYIESLKPLE
jgi:mono/diheme cytochrome c family protein